MNTAYAQLWPRVGSKLPRSIGRYLVRLIRVLVAFVVLTLIAAACSSDDAVVPNPLPQFNPVSVSPDSIDPYAPVDVVPVAGLDRCEWSSSGSPTLWQTCEQTADAQHDQAVINRDFVAENAVVEIRDDGDHLCFIDSDEIVTPAVPGDIPTDIGATLNGDVGDLPGGLSVYTVDDPIRAADVLLAAGIPASPRYVLMPSPRWKFGGGGAAIPGDGGIVDQQGSLAATGDGVIVIIDTGAAGTEPSNLSEAIRGHGEFIAGIVRRLLPSGVSVSERSALEDNGDASPVPTEHSTIKQIDDALGQVAGSNSGGELSEGGVVNLSLGTYACRPAQVPLELAARLGEIAKSNPDVVFVAAAGNDSHIKGDPPFWPAGFTDTELLDGAMTAWTHLDNYPLFESAISDLLEAQATAPIVVGVGAQVYDKSDPSSPTWLPAEFSNQVAATVWAPGANIVSNYPDWGGFAQWDGTSFAAPHVAALVARCQDPFASQNYRDALASIIENGSC